MHEVHTRAPRERSNVHVTSPELVLYWTTVLGCTKHALLDAVSKVGPCAEQVRLHLAEQASGATFILSEPFGHVA